MGNMFPSWFDLGWGKVQLCRACGLHVHSSAPTTTNLLCGVSNASRHKADINLTYHDLATHYNVAALPAHTSQPKDKAQFENGVLLATRLELGHLRHQRFHCCNLCCLVMYGAVQKNTVIARSEAL